ncbi:hypothetical protein T06_10060 [Trichinella sp. T6]|nr:hypothetical protein T06_10060 [Trichinella sp. T6]
MMNVIPVKLLKCDTMIDGRESNEINEAESSSTDEEDVSDYLDQEEDLITSSKLATYETGVKVLAERARKWCTSSDRMDTRYACDRKVRRCSKCFLCAALITLFKTAEIAL